MARWHSTEYYWWSVGKQGVNDCDVDKFLDDVFGTTSQRRVTRYQFYHFLSLSLKLNLLLLIVCRYIIKTSLP